MTTTAIQPPELLVVPLEMLSEHPENPRQHFDKDKIAELRDSIIAKGILVPLTVRPMPLSKPRPGPTGGTTNFQILAGHRRYQAAKLAGVNQIPVLINHGLTDEAAFEIMIVDNLQRDDVHPLDEALGYQRLIKQYREESQKNGTHPGKGGPVAPKFDVAVAMQKIAKTVGKSTSYIYQRLKLASLIEPAQKALFDGRITPGHAVMIARLQDPDQKRALAVCTTIVTETYDTDLQVKGIGREGSPPEEGCISVKALQQWIDEYIHVKVDSVAFEKSDAKLNPEAGPCTTCKKLTGNDPTLHPEIKSPRICTDHSCFRKKVIAHFDLVYKQYGNRLYPITSGNSYSHMDHDKPLEAAELTPRSWQQSLKGPGKWKPYTLKKGETDKTKRIKYGIFVDGPRKGECIPISLIEPKAKKSRSSNSTGSYSIDKPPSEAAIKKQREKEEKEALDKTVHEKCISEVFAKVVSKSRHPLPDFILREIADDRSDNFMPNDEDPEEYLRLCRKNKNQRTVDEACKLIVGTFIGEAIEYNGLQDDVVTRLAKHYGIDVKSIEKQVRAELTPKPKPVSGPPSPASGNKSPGHAPGWKKPAKKGKRK